MAHPLESKVLKEKALDKDLRLKVYANSDKIFVEYSAKNGRLVVQRSFYNDVDGKRESAKFQKQFKKVEDLLNYFDLNNRSNK